ncbi:hypothetical protein AKJ41_01900 [candidate division MSBL1 archaeon SCGC-AAA259O05]|uniref:Uncharacterized protein n=1 Tax=candidate division MSBL1 archaeon SCGC-AAA259O05 TaxID=1698271 RepID=A0A133V4G9_9EURY|nr:hypothetical protein AKJ41_01900 [candidate division MSBL1 archaeon SCGC-AAA259O05]
MSEATPRLGRVNGKIVRSAKEKLPEMAEAECPYWNGGLCRETGETCSFSACPLVDRIADSDED